MYNLSLFNRYVDYTLSGFNAHEISICHKSYILITGKFGKYYIWRMNHFERNWQILIWRLRRDYYSNDVAFDLAVFDLAINGQIR